MKEEPQNPDEDLKTAQYVIDQFFSHVKAVQTEKVDKTTTSVIAVARDLSKSRHVPIGMITSFSGEVSIQKQDEESWMPAKVGDQISPGDNVKTGSDGNMKLIVAQGEMTCFQETEVTIDEAADYVSGVFRMIQGKIRSVIKELRPKSKFEIHTPTAIVAVRGTDFAVAHSGEGTILEVNDGMVMLTVKSGGNTVAVQAGHKVIVSEDKGLQVI
jgi:hypothetical protein